MVYVINNNGEPLMPCSSRKARILLKEGKAQIVKRTPFTIKLLYGSSGYRQHITLGIDAGSKIVGISATTDKRELLSAELHLRTDIVGLISTRRACRSSRRSRKTRYRKSRFLNRKRDDGWLPPSIRNKIDSHISIIDNICKIIPISKIMIETAQFDIQKINNPDMSGEEYQNGSQKGFSNTREYVLWRDNHTCQHCNGKSKDKILQVHHIESRKTGGNAPNNLVTLCKTCHDRVSNNEVELKIKRGNLLRDASQMNMMGQSIYSKIREIHPNVGMMYGYQTKDIRRLNNIPKSHRNDALCITGYPNVTRDNNWYYYKKVRCQNRQIHKMTINKGGTRKLNQSPYTVHGFRLFDKVKFNDILCFIFARRLKGSFNIRTLDGNVISTGVTYRKLIMVDTRRTMLVERRIVED